ncbi:hypothetical protein QBC39DRAFT_381371 [Podospora conica]|nr:hypothetical protein QBC39DRAFT_381371 [Schizothecium conicum]
MASPTQGKGKADAPRSGARPGPFRRIVSSLRRRFPRRQAPRTHILSLPLEIRLQILTAAFGNRTIHVELNMRSPPHRHWIFSPFPKLVHSRPAHEHGGAAPPLVDYSSDDDRRRRCWVWSSVCHDVEPVGDKWDEPGSDRRPAALRSGMEDRCLHGEATKCQSWKRKGARGCEDTIGAMGWLLSCREAYHSGKQVLYSTNTFFFSDVLLNVLFFPMTPLPRSIQLAPVHLIKSIHLKLDVMMFGRAPIAGDVRPSPLHQIIGRQGGRPWLFERLRRLPDLIGKLPHLRHLAISFTDLLDHRPIVHTQSRKETLVWNVWLLMPLGAACLCMPQRLREGGKIIVELPENAYTHLTRGGMRPVAMRDREYGRSTAGALVRDERGRWVYRMAMWYTRADGQARRDFHDVFEMREGPKSDFVWSDRDQMRKSRMKERFPEEWGRFATIREYRDAYAMLMREGGELLEGVGLL